MSHGLRFTDEQYADLQKRRRDTVPAASEPARIRPQARATALPVPLERDVLSDVLVYLRYHPKVAFVWRANAGVFVVGDEGSERRVRAGFAGQSDILGMLIDGRFLAIECKRPGGQLSQDQHAFLSRVIRYGGVGFMAQGVDDVVRGLA